MFEMFSSHRYDSLTCSYLCLKSETPTNCSIIFDPNHGDLCIANTDPENLRRLVTVSKKSQVKHARVFHHASTSFKPNDARSRPNLDSKLSHRFSIFNFIVGHVLYMTRDDGLQDYSLDSTLSPDVPYDPDFVESERNSCGLFLPEDRELIVRYKDSDKFHSWYLGDKTSRVIATDPVGPRPATTCASDSETGTMVFYSGKNACLQPGVDLSGK